VVDLAIAAPVELTSGPLPNLFAAHPNPRGPPQPWDRAGHGSGIAMPWPRRPGR